jgi:membrane protein DedA with SNARE-associated domain
MYATLIAGAFSWFGDRFTEVSDWIAEVSDNWWFVFVIFTVALLDSVLPIVPGETTVIAGGVAAGTGNQNLALVILAGAAGAFIGDNIAYTIGNQFEGRVREWAERKPARSARLEGSAMQIRRRGGLLLITARFIPGGRTILTISSGITNQPRRWFAGWVAVAGLVWASYAAILGFIFGQAFEDDHAMAFWLAFGTALGLTAIIELIRWVRHPNVDAAIEHEIHDDASTGDPIDSGLDSGNPST